MTHIYTITGMTCNGCKAKVQGLLSKVPAVQDVSIELEQGTATIGMNRPIPTTELQAALKDYPKYKLSDAAESHTHHMAGTSAEGTMAGASEHESSDAPKSWLATYKPVLLILAYILGGTLLLETVDGGFSVMRWMSHFMAAFFLVFSFFKLLDLGAFADSYSSYDILASRWRGWGLLYPFFELGLGLLFLTGYHPLFTNAATLVIMGVSIIGVIRSVVHRRPIQCACLGAVFNLPMSTITILEDGLMIAMSVYSLVSMGN